MYFKCLFFFFHTGQSIAHGHEYKEQLSYTVSVQSVDGFQLKSSSVVADGTLYTVHVNFCYFPWCVQPSSGLK